MDFDLAPAQADYRDRARRFAEEHLAPVAAEHDEAETFPEAAFRRAAAEGYFGLLVPPEHGGAGADTVSYAVAIEELSRGMPAFGVPVSVHNSLVCYPLATLGSPEQRARYLPRLATGELLGGFALTEPDSGSDASAMRTTAREVEGGWVLNGRKTFVSMGATGSLFVVMAVTDSDAKRSRAISAFLVERSVPGFRTAERVSKMGMRATDTAALEFEDVYLPDACLLGGRGGGFTVALGALDGGRIGIAAQSVGIAQAALDEAAAYALRREQFGEPIVRFQAVQFRLADMATEIEAARLLTLRAAALKDRGASVTKEAAIAKLMASQAAVRAADAAVQIHGGYGYIKPNAAERLYRDAKVTEIYEGTSEIQRGVIAEQLLREPATYPLPDMATL